MPTKALPHKSNGLSPSVVASSKPIEHSRALSPPDLYNPIPNPRDSEGNRLSTSGSYIDPIRADRPARETALAGVLDVIGQRLPGAAAALETFHDDRLLEARRLYRAAVEHIYAVHLELRGRAISHNEELNHRIEILEQQRDRATSAEWRERDVLQEREGAACAMAAVTCSRVGASFNPAEPNRTPIIRAQPRSLSTIAGETGTEYDADNGYTTRLDVVGLLVTSIPGALSGVSLGLCSGALVAETLFDDIGPLLWCAFAGVGLAMATKAALFGFGYLFGRSHTPNRVPKAAGRTALTILIGLILWLGYVAIDSQGILAFHNSATELQQLSQTTPSDQSTSLLTVVLIGATTILSLPFVTRALVQGYIAGRHCSATNYLTSIAHGETESAEERQRASTDHQIAIASAALVDCVRAELDAQTHKIARIEKPFDDAIVELKADRLTVHHELSQHDRLMIQQLHDGVVGAQKEFDEMLAAALASVEPSLLVWRGSWWRFLGWLPLRLFIRRRGGCRG